MIILNVPKDKHEQVKKLGVTYRVHVKNTYTVPYDIKGCWCLDDKKASLAAVLPWITPENIPFDNLCNEIANKEDKDSKVYHFTADVIKVIPSLNNAFYMLTLNNRDRPNVDLKAKLVDKKNCLDLIGKKVKVTGIIYWYERFNTYQINILKLEVIGDTIRPAIPNPIRLQFADIFDSVGQELDIPTKGYMISADVHDVYVSKDGTSYIYTLYTDHNLSRTLRCKITPDLLNGVKYDELVDKNITIVGTIFLYKPSLSFQINAISVTINGPCTRIRELNDWEKACQPLFHEEKYRPLDGIKKIGLISNSQNSGCIDFKSRIHALNMDDIIFKDIPMTQNELIKAILELNKEDLDAICIIRGGSDPETLINFSRPEFLKAIAFSKIPVITGIGHANDELLCNKVAYYRALTPTDAADYINKQIYREKRASHAKQYDNYGAKNQAEKQDWLKKYLDAEARIEELENENSELNRQLEQLKRNGGKRSLLARIFNW